MQSANKPVKGAMWSKGLYAAGAAAASAAIYTSYYYSNLPNAPSPPPEARADGTGDVKKYEDRIRALANSNPYHDKRYLNLINSSWLNHMMRMYNPVLTWLHISKTAEVKNEPKPQDGILSIPDALTPRRRWSRLTQTAFTTAAATAAAAAAAAAAIITPTVMVGVI